MRNGGPEVSAETARGALVAIAAVVCGAAFYWLNAILTPLALALFLMVMIDGLARALAKIPGSPARAALPVAIGVAVVVFSLSVYVLADNLRSFAAELVSDAPKLNQQLARLASAMGVEETPTIGQVVSTLNPSGLAGRLLGAVRSVAADAFLTLIYLGFLLASRQGFERKAGALFPTDAERTNAEGLFVRIRSAIEKYLWVQTVTCGMIAIASFAVMTSLGLDNALFWAFAIFVVGFIPIIGGAVGILGPPLFALIQFNDWLRALGMLAALQVINFVVGNIVYPRMQGESLNIDPVAVLLSLAFWGAVWGVPGMFLSTPLTVMAMVVLAQFGATRWIAVLISRDGDPLGLGVRR